jgi:uncharacterized RDD family membrane protein YckC
VLDNYYFRRVAAKAIDLLVCLALGHFLSIYLPFIGTLVGMALLLFSDSIGHGAGLAKRFFGLRVTPESLAGGDGPRAQGGSIRWPQSALRNFPLALVLGLSAVPVIGLALWFIFNLPYCIFEIYLMFSLRERKRLGDVLAETVVLSLTAPKENSN